jgi:hypothetical protein
VFRRQNQKSIDHMKNKGSDCLDAFWDGITRASRLERSAMTQSQNGRL